MLDEAGVLLLAATDVGIPMLVPGLSLHEELVLLVEAGLTPLEALPDCHREPCAACWAWPTRWEPSRRASWPISSSSTPNPLADISNTRRIRAVVANGRLFRRADLLYPTCARRRSSRFLTSATCGCSAGSAFAHSSTNRP